MTPDLIPEKIISIMTLVTRLCDPTEMSESFDPFMPSNTGRMPKSRFEAS